MDKKGLALVVVLGILAVLVLTATAFVGLTAGETQMVKRQTNSIRAFYLAEAGAEEAIYNLLAGDADDFDGKLYSGNNEYSVDLESSGNTYTVISTGSYPDLAASDKTTRKVRADVTLVPNGNPGNVTNAIETNGTLTIAGGVDIGGTTETNASVDFQSVFGLTKEQMEAIADHVYTDPANNTIPVDNITWVNLVNNNEFIISSEGWSGSGILIVEESAGSTTEALKITGGQFTGIIWVIGNLRISGNTDIAGAIFVENGATEVSKLTGTPDIAYDASAVNNAFKSMGGSLGGISNWQEVV